MQCKEGADAVQYRTVLPDEEAMHCACPYTLQHDAYDASNYVLDGMSASVCIMEPSEMEIRVMALALRNACANADIFAAQSFAPLLDALKAVHLKPSLHKPLAEVVKECLDKLLDWLPAKNSPSTVLAIKKKAAVQGILPFIKGEQLAFAAVESCFGILQATSSLEQQDLEQLLECGYFTDRAATFVTCILVTTCFSNMQPVISKFLDMTHMTCARRMLWVVEEASAGKIVGRLTATHVDILVDGLSSSSQAYAIRCAEVKLHHPTQASKCSSCLATNPPTPPHLLSPDPVPDGALEDGHHPGGVLLLHS
jgi:hypothetical protein